MALFPVALFAVVMGFWWKTFHHLAASRLYADINILGMILALYVAIVLLSYILFLFDVWRLRAKARNGIAQ